MLAGVPGRRRRPARCPALPPAPCCHACLIDAGPLLRLAAQQGGHQRMQLRAVLRRQGRVCAAQDLWAREGWMWMWRAQACLHEGPTPCLRTEYAVLHGAERPPTLTAIADTELPRKGRCSVASSYSTQPATGEWRFEGNHGKCATSSRAGAALDVHKIVPAPAAQISAFFEYGLSCVGPGRQLAAGRMAAASHDAFLCTLNQTCGAAPMPLL